jgi:hypothetical protein
LNDGSKTEPPFDFIGFAPEVNENAGFGASERDFRAGASHMVFLGSGER